MCRIPDALGDENPKIAEDFRRREKQISQESERIHGGVCRDSVSVEVFIWRECPRSFTR